MSKMIELCPFCGSTDIEGPFPENQQKVNWIIRCGNPECGVEMMGETAEDVVRKWNKRNTHNAMNVLTSDIQKNKYYAFGWHSNIAIVIYDNIPE